MLTVKYAMPMDASDVSWVLIFKLIIHVQDVRENVENVKLLIQLNVQVVKEAIILIKPHNYV